MDWISFFGWFLLRCVVGALGLAATFVFACSAAFTVRVTRRVLRRIRGLENLVVLLTFVSLALTGCSGAREFGGVMASRVSLNTNIPYHGAVMTVMNQSDAPVNVFVDGRPIAEIAPGGHQALEWINFSGGYGQHDVQVVGPKGATYRSVSVSGYSQSSETWIVTASELRR